MSSAKELAAVSLRGRIGLLPGAIDVLLTDSICEETECEKIYAEMFEKG